MSSAADELEDLEPDAADPAADLVEAPEGSELASLRTRVAKAKQALHFDLEVPRLDPPVFVRYRPVPSDRMEKTFKRTEKLRNDRTVVTNAIILADACEGVFELDANGEPVSIDPDDRDGEWPKFGPRLAELLGEPMLKKAVDIARALYPTDGDLISTAQDLAVRSGYAQEQLERESEGN